MKNNDPFIQAFVVFNSEDDPILNASQKRLKAKTATLETDFVLIEGKEVKDGVEISETPTKKIFRGKLPNKKPAVCEHNRVGYRDLERIINRSMLVISRLAKVMVEMEDKFSQTSETVEYLTETFEDKERNYLEAIDRLKRRVIQLGGPDYDKPPVRRDN